MPVVSSELQKRQPVSNSWEDWRPALDRCLLISWLLKDLGWMTTDVYLAWPFGLLSICLHILVLIIDWSSSVANRFYHTSLLLWIVGNFLWMSVEFMVSSQSSSIHLGPDTPLGGMTSETGDKLTNVKSKLFLVAIFLQLTLFACIRFDVIQMPHDSDSELGHEEDLLWEEIDEEMLRAIEGAEEGADTGDVPSGEAEDRQLSGAHKHRTSRSVSDPAHWNRDRSLSSDADMDTSVLDSFRRFIPTTRKYPLGFSLSFIENGYIVLWICKDYFWSWATGDFNIERRAGYLAEFVSMFFGVLSVCLYTFVAYAWRRNFVNLMDSLTSWCWLFSNFTWMAGEIFIRYDSMQLNDDTQGDDGLTRLVSGVFFVAGINVQVCVLCHFVLESRQSSATRDTFNSSGSRVCGASGGGSSPLLESTMELPDKWVDIEISGAEGSRGIASRLPKLSLGEFLPKASSGGGSHKCVPVQAVEEQL